TSPRLALLFLILIPLVAGIILFAFRRMFPLFGVVQRRLDALNGVLQENLAGVRVVRVFARGPFETERFFGANTSLKNANLAAVRLGVVIMPALIMVLNLGLTAAIWFGGIQIDRGQLQVGELIAFTNYLVQSLFALMMTSMLVVRLSRAEASAERVAEVLANSPEIVPPAHPLRELAGRGEVVFDDVSFRYTGKADQNGMTGDTEPVLRQVSFTARPGQTVAILGATGSGKSTLVNLIPRFYDVSAGRILIDGVDIRQIDETTLRGAIAMALQESILFTGSIRDNIRFGRPDASDAEVRQAAKMAQAHEFIEALPEGYDAIVGQRGVNLSGGQKQRIAIARALILGSPILILDDSTSAVDVATERRIQEALSGMRQTCIIVAQRISAVVGADMILVLDGGRIVAQGTHDELMATSGVYRDIYESQMETGAVVYGAA
ncbi:MAG: ABC transporter ATP-binding protein/permease, partial [Chloroflexota bacterium]|nr:ABC transporter ATP-binding protein/permease [Chloroflexota bacterium]